MLLIFIQFCVLLFASLSTYTLNTHLSISPILVSASITAFFVSINKLTLKRKNFEVLFYCGSFIGMTMPIFINQNILIFLLTSTVALLIHRTLENSIIGFGGKVGSIAFISVIFVIVIRSQL